MNFVRNIHFTLLIKVQGRLCEFNFRKREPGLYDGDVSDERGNRHYFKLRKETDQWLIQADAIPAWLSASATLVNQAMLEKEASGQEH